MDHFSNFKYQSGFFQTTWSIPFSNLHICIDSCQCRPSEFVHFGKVSMWTLYVFPLQRFRRAKDLDTWNIFQANVGEFVWGLSKLLCLITFRFNSTKSNRPLRVLKIVILFASGRTVQSHDCYKGKTRSKIDFLMCGANIFLQIPVLYVFSRVRFFFYFFFYFNWRLPLSVFNSRAIFVVGLTKMALDEGMIQLIKHTWGFLTDNLLVNIATFKVRCFCRRVQKSAV